MKCTILADDPRAVKGRKASTPCAFSYRQGQRSLPTISITTILRYNSPSPSPSFHFKLRNFKLKHCTPNQCRQQNRTNRNLRNEKAKGSYAYSRNARHMTPLAVGAIDNKPSNDAEVCRPAVANSHRRRRPSLARHLLQLERIMR
ncbi:hypothetical protein EVAR_17934_1 [Eumeta japonica]|uniref:Uncharacterized protein n=1 Tax=Eumeta variegata TaxID=151549 RepID=A0A4C1UY99_EUMVA|nr:hypothetical protein EVAR_17934_1 [Eumeta japonica]